MCLSGIIGGATAIIGASAASDAADAQAAAAQQQIALQEQIYNDQRELFSPYYDAGTNALAAQQYLLGLGPAPMIGGSPAPITTEVIGGGTPPENSLRSLIGGSAPDWAADVNNAPPGYVIPDHRTPKTHVLEGSPLAGGSAGQTLYKVGDQTFATLEEAQAYAAANPVGGTQYGGFQASPGYQFALDQGLSAIDASASAGGNLYSGATMQAAQQYGQGLANQEFNNYYNQVSGVAGAGQAAAGQTAQAGTNYATGASNALANMGNAQAAGAIGTSNALMNGLNTGLGLYQYQNSLNGNQNSLSLF